MKLKLRENPSVVAHIDGTRTLAIFPSRPFWIAGGLALPQAIQELNGIDWVSDDASTPHFATLDKQRIALVKLLMEAGILIPEDKNTDIFNHDIEPRAQLHDVEIILIISLTEGCNLFCPHCYANAQRRRKDEMTTDQVFELLRQVKELPWGPDESSIGLIGGEPLLRRDFLNITDHINDLGYEIVLSTNGLLLADEHIQKFRTYRIKVSISLDGASAKDHEYIRGPNTFSTVVRSIQRLVEAGIPVGINTFVHSKNFAHLEDVFSIAVGLGVHSMNVNTLMYVGRGLNEIIHPISRTKLYRRIFEIASNNNQYLQLIQKSNFANKVIAVKGGLKSRYCGIGSNRALYVRSDGTLYPCGDTCIPSFQLSDLKTSHLAQIWETSERLKELRRLDIDKMNLTCARCDVRYYCAGDCRGEHYQKTGEFLTPHFKCQEIRDSILEIMWMLAERPNFLNDRTTEVVKKAKLVSSEE